MEWSGRGVVQKRREKTNNRSEYMKDLFMYFLQEKLEELQGNKTSILRGLN